MTWIIIPKENKKQGYFIICLLISVTTGIIDYLSGPDLTLSVFYLLPILISSWFIGRKSGIFFSFFCAFLWFLLEFYSQNFPGLYYAWNGLVRWSFLFIISITFSELQATLINLRKTIYNLNISLEKEKELGILKSNFIKLVSHEFRTPLSIIFTTTELLEMYENMLTKEDKKEQFDIIKSQIGNVTLMLNDLLRMGQLEEVSQHLFYESFDLKETINEIICNLKIAFPDKIIEFISEKENFKIISDRKILKYITINLLSNALKYSFPGGKIIVKVSLIDEKLILLVCDKGVGIPEQEINEIFEPFYRCKNVGNISGSGLGLSIVKSYIEIVKGNISVKSKLNEGTSFIINIPVAKGDLW